MATSMSASIWIPLAVATALGLSTAVSFVVAAILGHIGTEVGQLLESGPLALAPLLPAEPVARAR
jgi:hypothetical protein